MDIKIVEEARKPLAMHPKKFALWLFIVTISMLFAAWTSAYIVRRGAGEWAEVVLPWQFWMNSGIIVLSSLSMIWAVRAAKHDNLEVAKVMIAITTILGLGFLAGQVLAYGELIRMNEYFSGGNVSHSFIYVLTGAHGLHLVSGVVYLVIAFVSVFRYKVHSKNMIRLEMCATYWHFLGILWLYLFLFLLLNR